MSFDLFDFIPSNVNTTVNSTVTNVVNTIITPDLATAISVARTPRQMAEDNLAAMCLLLDLRDVPTHAHNLDDEERLTLLRYQG